MNCSKCKAPGVCICEPPALANAELIGQAEKAILSLVKRTATMKAMRDALEGVLGLAESYLNFMPDRHGHNIAKLEAAREAIAAFDKALNEPPAAHPFPRGWARHSALLNAEQIVVEEITGEEICRRYTGGLERARKRIEFLRTGVITAGDIAIDARPAHGGEQP